MRGEEHPEVKGQILEEPTFKRPIQEAFLCNNLKGQPRRPNFQEPPS